MLLWGSGNNHLTRLGHMGSVFVSTRIALEMILGLTIRMDTIPIIGCYTRAGLLYKLLKLLRICYSTIMCYHSVTSYYM